MLKHIYFCEIQENELLLFRRTMSQLCNVANNSDSQMEISLPLENLYVFS